MNISTNSTPIAITDLSETLTQCANPACIGSGEYVYEEAHFDEYHDHVNYRCCDCGFTVWSDF